MPDAPSLLTGGQGRGFPRVDEPSGQFNGVAAAREGDSDHGDACAGWLGHPLAQRRHAPHRGRLITARRGPVSTALPLAFNHG